MKEKNREEEKEPKPFNVILLGNVKSEKEARIHKLIIYYKIIIIL